MLVNHLCPCADFDDLWKAFSKAQAVIQKEEGGQVPRFYVRCMAEGEDFINSVWEDRNARSVQVAALAVVLTAFVDAESRV